MAVRQGSGGVGVGPRLLRLLSALLLLGASCAWAIGAETYAVAGRDAVHVLFGASAGRDHAQDQRRLRAAGEDGVSYETLLLVAHPSRADASQKKVQQMHRGLELWGHTFVIGLGADGVTETAEGTFGTVFTDLDRVLPDTSPSLTSEDAARVAEGSTSAAAISSKLVIWVDKERGSAAHLAYVVTLTSSPGRAYALVDAKSGEVLRTWRDQPTQHASRPRPKDSSMQRLPEIAASDAGPQPGAARRSLQQSKGTLVNVWAIGGNEKVGRIYYNGTNGNPQLQVTRIANNCSFINADTKTGDIHRFFTRQEWLNHSWTRFVDDASVPWLTRNLSEVKRIYDSVPTVTYPCPSKGRYVNTTDAFKGSYSQQADIQAIMSIIFKMWRTWLKVDVIKLFAAAGVPTPLLVIPHVDPDWENAAWNNFYFLCGDGTSSYPLCTAGDVLAHELTHGITQLINGGLIGYSGQPAGWNEGFSDMAGMTYTFFATGRVDPEIGAAITRTTPGIRNMSDPGQNGGTTTVLNLTSQDGHTMAGVPGLAFYTLATSPCFDPKVAMTVAQRAAHLYFTPTASFLEGANAWVRAAADLGYSTAAVRKVWEGLGLWEVCGNPSVLTDTGTFKNPVPTIFSKLGHPEVFLGPYDANVSVYLGNVTNAAATAGGPAGSTFLAQVGKPCGIAFSLKSELDTNGLYAEQLRPSVYVGINRVPDPDAGLAGWDCMIYMEGSLPGPAVAACNLPVIANATYHAVARGSHSWKLQVFSYSMWGPTAGEDTAPGADGSAPKCFNGGTCLGDSGCSSGHCVKGYCAAKSKRAAARARRALV